MPLFSVMFCIVGLFVFLMTYATKYGFFPYSLFSFSALWLWGIAGLYGAVISIVVASPFLWLLFSKRLQLKSNSIILCLLCIGVIVLLILINNILIPLGLFITFLLAEIAIGFYKNKKLIRIVIGIILTIFLYLCLIFLLSDFFTQAFEKFLKTKGLAAENAEIYLKDKQKFVYGTLRFMDSKNAYVEFCDEGQDCQKDIKAKSKKVVPVQDVTILKDPETIKESKKPQDSKDAQASQGPGNSQNPKESIK
ncbi:hypothetical protein [Helicobacter sp. 11S02596-1]|uniref:hypothetical protein n=1 Tax=Helicobacter sp. 11S02596-1 TaxID=1476194 RepID=UPI000BA783F6|nr:hypothetical protein [Helicobacter sp. 11S02596-1]PAF41274.1 hypothetical protein BJI48_08900 [Helicobacter sp. 11S02596-1]